MEGFCFRCIAGFFWVQLIAMYSLEGQGVISIDDSSIVSQSSIVKIDKFHSLYSCTHIQQKGKTSVLLDCFFFLQRKGHCPGGQYCQVFGSPFHTPFTWKKRSSSTVRFNISRSLICLSYMACQSFLVEAQDYTSPRWPTQISY